MSPVIMDGLSDMYDEILVEAIDGSEQFSFSGLFKNMSVLRFKHVVAQRFSRAVNRQVDVKEFQLYTRGEVMEDSRTLISYDLKDGCTITRVDLIDETPTELKPKPKENNDELPPYSEALKGKVLKNVFIQDTDKTYTLNNVPVNTTVEELGKRLNEEKGLDPDYLRLIFNGKQMRKGFKLVDLDVQEDSTLIILVRFPGGDRITI
ncbi:hypothetical protein AOQ84DRAFT_382138 [Glonium stellatum]|uniref:Ubiquitin-like domain-containing protein n=1 Tax=Glonium stellatum TaxID=574774 RepID=A0A8E2JMW5_9PEZI|nr:hypothetical protein AOQ84DRAFT_382138 [Glonium stellatum]